MELSLTPVVFSRSLQAVSEPHTRQHSSSARWDSLGLNMVQIPISAEAARDCEIFCRCHDTTRLLTVCTDMHGAEQFDQTPLHQVLPQVAGSPCIADSRGHSCHLLIRTALKCLPPAAGASQEDERALLHCQGQGAPGCHRAQEERHSAGAHSGEPRLQQLAAVVCMWFMCASWLLLKVLVCVGNDVSQWRQYLLCFHMQAEQ